MSASEPKTASAVQRTQDAYEIRRARPEDARAVAVALSSLLEELSGGSPPLAAMQEACEALLVSEREGVVLLAETDQLLVGVLAVSWQTAIHIPGRYGLIQDLWVAPSHRSRAIGAALIDALSELARELGIKRLEVGLPRESFAGIDATAAFYERVGFDPLGPRMRRLLS